jgi:Type II CAAX prenyl endopeptidase Rce1-like
MNATHRPWSSSAAWIGLLLVGGLAGAWLAKKYASVSLLPQGLYAWFNVIFLAPLLEEWALRSVLLPSVSSWLDQRVKRHGEFLANALVSTLFVLLHHGVAGSLAWLWFFPSWVLGLVWFRFQSVWACALTHAWFNAALILVSMLATQSAQAQSQVPMLKAACAMNATVLISAQHQVGSKKLQASVLKEAGRLVLEVGEVLPSGVVACMRNSHLLGADATKLPSLSFDENQMLTVRWHLSHAHTHAHSPVEHERYEMVFDAKQAVWPLVRYRHEQASTNTRSGVDAHLAQFTASWSRLDANETTPRAMTAPLQALPLLSLASVPKYTDYALQPLTNKIHQMPVR